MALHAIFVLENPLFNVLFTDLRSRVLVTAVTGVISIVVVHVARHTVSVMVPVEAEVFFMFKSGRQPSLLRVALPTAALDL